MKKVVCFLVFIFLFFACTKEILANQDQYISVVNPVRMSGYTQNITKNLEAQYKVVSGNGLAATWLLTFDILANEDAVEEIRKFNKDQEIGIFLEVTPLFSKASKVRYHDTGSWHHATSVFLSGYTQKEREQFIDTVFEEFKRKLGYYPASVGAWWIDSYSLAFMKEKYGIIANLGLADQFSTDGYQVWGTYWSTPYYPSKFHTGMPANDISVKLDVVNTQWAPRDPLNGYYSSLFSTQDYHTTKEANNIDYFEKLVTLYAARNDNNFGYVTVGLEGDFNPEVYEGIYTQNLSVVKSLKASGNYQVVTMSQFSQWYRKSFPNLSPPHIIKSDDLLGLPKKVFWYQSPNYRIGLIYDKERKQTKIFDLRTYHANFQEPFYATPNKEFELSIYIPSVLDEINNPEDVWLIDSGSLEVEEKTGDSLKLEFEKIKITLMPDGIIVSGNNLNLPFKVERSSTLTIKAKDEGYELLPTKNWIIGREGYIFRDLTDVATHELQRKRTTFILVISLFIFIILSLKIIFSKLSDRKKTLLLGLLIVPPFSFFHFWYQKNTINYYVSQAEVDALNYLSLQPPGKVVVFDHECLGCSWNSKEKPAVFANKRSYVQKWGRHSVVYNSQVFKAKSQAEAKEEFEKLGADYIYLAKYEDYIEKTPFSPGDLEIEKIYGNANAEVWRVTKK